MQSYDFSCALMPRKNTSDPESFGARMARFREAAGYTQRTLATEIGISQRMVAYYESQSDHPPAHLLPALSDAFGLSVDQLLGREAVSPKKRPTNVHLMRKLQQVEKLSPAERRQVLQLIDALVERNVLRRQRGA